MILYMKEEFYKIVAQWFKSRPRVVRYAHNRIMDIERKQRQLRTASEQKGNIARCVKELCWKGSTSTFERDVADWFASKGYSVKKFENSNGFQISTEPSQKELSDIMMKK